jgi:hypothetical protein
LILCAFCEKFPGMKRANVFQPIGAPLKHGTKAQQVRVLKMRYPELGPSALAKRVGVTPQSASDALKPFLSNASEEKLRSFQLNRSDAWDAIGMRSLESVTEAKLRKASASSLATIAAIAEDKRRAILGIPQQVEVHTLVEVLAVVRGDSEKP